MSYAHLLAAAQISAADTVVTVVPRDALATASDIALLVMAVAVAVVAVSFFRLMVQMHRSLREIRTAVRQNIGPVSDRARGISDNVEFITDALRADVSRLTASVKALTDRLQQASDRMEERIEEFNALMEVVQGEAEDIFIDTAATVRGVRAGARSIGGGEQTRPSTSPGEVEEYEDEAPAGGEE